MLGGSGVCPEVLPYTLHLSVPESPDSLSENSDQKRNVAPWWDRLGVGSLQRVPRLVAHDSPKALTSVFHFQASRNSAPRRCGISLLYTFFIPSPFYSCPLGSLFSLSYAPSITYRVASYLNAFFPRDVSEPSRLRSGQQDNSVWVKVLVSKPDEPKFNFQDPRSLSSLLPSRHGQL